MIVSGTVNHDASTETINRKFAQIIFFMADGTFVAFATVIDDDGSFEAMGSGDVVHVAVQVTDSTKVRQVSVTLPADMSLVSKNPVSIRYSLNREDSAPRLRRGVAG